MDCRERVLTTLNLEEPDCIPTHSLYLTANMVDKLLGPPARNNFETLIGLQLDFPDTWVEQFNGLLDEVQIDRFSRVVEAAHKIGLDCIQIGIIPLKLLPPDWNLVEIKNPTKYEPGKFDMKYEMIDIFGKVWTLRDIEGNITPQYKRATVTSLERWQEIKSKFEDGTNNKYCRLAKKYFKRVNRKFKDKVYIFATNQLASIWSSAWQGMSMPYFSKHLYSNRKLIKEIFDTYTDFTIDWMNAYMDGGAEVCLCTDDLSTKTGPMMSPKTFTELLQPCYQRLTESIHDRGGKIILHTDGQITPLLDFIVGCGFDGLHCLEPAAGVDLADIKKKVGDKLCLFGNIDMAILSNGTESEVEKAVKYAIKTAGPNGGYVVSPENTIYTVKIKLLKAMIEAVHKYGKYPINM
jgi:uroporphyrinogen-III decarboxylase